MSLFSGMSVDVPSVFITRWVDGPRRVDGLIVALRISGPSPALYVSFEKRNTLWKLPDNSGVMSARSKRSSRGGSVLRLGYSGVPAAAAGAATAVAISGAATTEARIALESRRIQRRELGIVSSSPRTPAPPRSTTCPTGDICTEWGGD